MNCIIKVLLKMVVMKHPVVDCKKESKKDSLSSPLNWVTQTTAAGVTLALQSIYIKHNVRPFSSV